MAVVAQDIERELYKRVSPLQPVMAPKLVQRLAQLPNASSLLSSELALSRAVDWAVAQEQRELQEKASAPTLTTVTTAVPTVVTTVPAVTTAVLPGVTTAVPTVPLVTTTTPSTMIYRCVQSPAPTSASLKEPAPVTPVSEKLMDRVARIEPEMASLILEKILDHGPAVVNECFTSDLALQQRMDAAVGALRREAAAKKLAEAQAAAAAAARPPPMATQSVPLLSGSLPKGITGLEEFLQDLSLAEYTPQAADWGASMGAVTLDELVANSEDFADALGLRPLERSRLQRDGPGLAARLR